MPEDEPHPSYDLIGAGYSKVRHPDPRLASAISVALGDSCSVLNVGAGAGAYEPGDRSVTSCDPSRVMLAQHPGRRKALASAEALPFAAGAFDASMATLTVHHWPDLAGGIRELRRVSSRQVIFTWDPDCERILWLWEDYLPALVAFERSRFPTLQSVVDLVAAHTVSVFEIPHDFTDGFQFAWWRRPEAFLDPTIRAASSMFATLPAGTVEPAIERLRADLHSGAWKRAHADLLDASSIDYGWRILIAGSEPPSLVP